MKVAPLAGRLSHNPNTFLRMLTFSKLGKHGRLANCMFQIAAMFGFAKKHNVILTLPDWEYLPYFPNLNWMKTPTTGKQINEPAFHATPEFYDSLDWSKSMDFLGYFQSPKYFPPNVKDLFAFDPEFAKACREPFSEAFKKPTIAIHVRRQDYVGNDCYVSLPPTYYILSLIENFPDWRECNLIFFSDDIEYCRIHYQCLPNAFFSDNFVDIADLCLMSQCDHFIIANSSFSWFGAFLGEKEGTKVVYPVRHFAGKLKNNSTRDLYPENWIPFSDEGKKIDLRDCTFVVPIKYDHSDRKENIELCLTMLLSVFDTNILIGEQGGKHFEYLSEFCEYRNFSEMEVFHRTKILNDLYNQVETPFAANFDSDCVFAPAQIWQTLEALRSGFDIVSPYNGGFAQLPRSPWYQRLCSSLDVGIFGDTKFDGRGINPNSADAVGGAFFFNVESYRKAGFENERFVSWSREDGERWERVNILGLKVKRIGGFIYHVRHWVGVDSSMENPYWAKGEREYERIRKMSKKELELEVSTWAWAKVD